MVTFGYFFSYSLTVSASHFFAPAASWSPHHHIVRFTSSAGALFAARAARLAPVSTAAATQATTATTQMRPRMPLLSFDPRSVIFSLRDADLNSTSHRSSAHSARSWPDNTSQPSSVTSTICSTRTPSPPPYEPGSSAITMPGSSTAVLPGTIRGSSW